MSGGRVTLFSEVFSPKTWDITHTVEGMKLQETFTMVDYWESDGTIAVVPNQDFYHRNFERKKFHSNGTLLQTAVTCHVKIGTFENVIIWLG